MLSFAELGVGSAIIYSMYKPLATNDREKLKTLTKLYKKAYTVIGSTILIIGLLIIPFLKFIIKEPPKIEESLVLIYVLFLFNTGVSYFFSYKTSIITADQKNYIIVAYQQIVKWIQSIIQIVILILTKNYILFLIIQLLCTIMTNVILYNKSCKMYPYLKEKDITPLSQKERKDIVTNVKSMFLYKLSPAILNGTDNIFISYIIGVAAVGLYSNYYLIVNYLTLFISQVNGAVNASIGNLNAIGERENQEKVLYKILCVDFILYGFCGVLVFSLIQDFINIWIGKEYLLSTITVFSIVLYFFIGGMQFVTSSYRTTSGLFSKIKYAPIFEVVINIVFSIILGKLIGLPGIFFATTLSKLLVFFWVDPYIIYKDLLKSKISTYFKKYIKYTAIYIITCFLCYYISSLIPVSNFILWFLKAILIALITFIIYFITLFKTDEYKGLKDIFNNFILKKIMKKGV